MLVRVNTKLVSAEIESTSIQFNGDKVLIFTADNGFSSFDIADIYDVEFAKSKPAYKPSVLRLAKYLRESEGISISEAARKARQLMGE